MENLMSKPVQERVISKDGTRIGYVKTGSGHPLLCVHGTSAEHNSWLRLAPHLQQHLTLCVMDRRGRGMSGDGPEYHILREAEDVAAVIDSLSEPVTLLGHSYGGLISLEASLLTGNISRLILYEPIVKKEVELLPPGFTDRMNELIDRGKKEEALVIFYREVVRMPDRELETMRSSPLWQARVRYVPTVPRELEFEKNHTVDSEKFAGIRVPVVLLTGSESPPLFKKSADILDRMLSQSRIVTLPGEQHIAHITNPKLLSEVILEQTKAG